MKRILSATTATLMLMWSLVAGASAADESIELSLEASPVGGKLYREVARPVEAGLAVKVDVPEGEPQITPMIVSNVTFPSDMSFHPNPKVTPACPEEKVGTQSALADGIEAIVAECPRSVIGTGTAIVQAGQLAAPFASLPAQMVIFNAGRNAAGRPKITIYGYSRLANAGVIMMGVLATNGELRIDVGQLPYDSSVAEFSLGIPGTPLVPDGSSAGESIRGLDPAYLRATCTTGTWLATGAFTLGDRDPSTGGLIGEPRLLHSNPVELPCRGAAGKARLGFVGLPKVKRLRKGRTSVLSFKVKNSGTATARSIRINVKGAAKGTVGLKRLAPGATTGVKVRIKARAAGFRGKLKLSLKGGGVPTKRVAIKAKFR
ncbi:MAG: hypothetical protein J0H98_09100 [Solirubrobacterales bacterium]|nr:hypothetical protein [Solirubrobacterales bacterium]